MKKILFIFLALLILGELGARYILGLGEPPIYIEDSDFEYIYAPKQNTNRFGNQIITNEYSMRSLPLHENEKRVLVFGDSVLNGGSLTDHKNLATTLLEQFVQNSCDNSVRVLNISAGSWGPDNAFAYLKKYGDFNATDIILVFSSHDAHDNMMHEKVVDVHPSYPSEQPCCALWEGFDRYLVPRIKQIFSKKKEEFSKIHKIDISEQFNDGWENFINYTRDNHIKLYVVLHSDREEYEKGKYNQDGQKIIQFLEMKKVPIVLDLNNTKKEFFRDDIHFNDKGQNFLFLKIMPILKQEFCRGVNQL